MNGAANIWRFLIVLALLACATLIYGERNFSLGAGGGVFFLGGGVDTHFSHGQMATLFLEASPPKGFGMRLEGSWLKFPGAPVLDVLPAVYFPPEEYPGRSEAPDKPRPELIGGSFSLMWFDPPGRMGRTYVLFSAGAYQGSEYGQRHTVFIVGPGVGITLGHSKSIGFEMNVGVGSVFMVPLRLFVRM